MVYLSENWWIFHGYVSHNQMVPFFLWTITPIKKFPMADWNANKSKLLSTKKKLRNQFILPKKGNTPPRP